jgi:hypothetical protein
MARPTKDGVEYFPHFVSWGKTIPILENRFGNDGYAVWFKILEMLGKSKRHFIDCNNELDWQFTVQKFRVSEEIATEILDMLARLETIDAELWTSHRVIWCQNFVDQLAGVYSKRKVAAPEKPDKRDSRYENAGNADVTDTITPQSKVEESIGEDSRGEESSNSGKPESEYPPKFLEFWSAYPKKKSKGDALKAWKSQRCAGLLPDILKAVEAQKHTHDWIKDGGKFIPHPAKWLRARSWEDEIEGEKKTEYFNGHTWDKDD